MAVGSITAIRRTRKSSSRLAVFVDGERTLMLPEEVALKLGLRPGVEWSEELLSLASGETDRVYAREGALRLLAARGRSEWELTDRLRRKGVASELAESVVKELSEAGLVDDLAFARQWSSERVRQRPIGRRRLVHELRSKRIASEIIEEVANETYTANPESVLARRAVERKVARAGALDWKRDRPRFYAFVMRRGFSHDVTSQALGEIERELDV